MTGLSILVALFIWWLLIALIFMVLCAIKTFQLRNQLLLEDPDYHFSGWFYLLQDVRQKNYSHLDAGSPLYAACEELHKLILWLLVSLIIALLLKLGLRVFYGV